MKKIFVLFVFAVFLFSAIPVANAKLIIINTKSYEPPKESQIEKNITRTVIITKQRRISNFAFDQTYYNFERNQIFSKKINDIINKEPTYEDKTAEQGPYLPIPKSQYSKYYECYDEQYDRYYKDYDYWNPCLD